jgi:hypothetical protein
MDFVKHQYIAASLLVTISDFLILNIDWFWGLSADATAALLKINVGEPYGFHDVSTKNKIQSFECLVSGWMKGRLD